MICKNCNGNLIYENGYYLCDSCGTKFSVQEYYDNTEVFLLYAENDTNGRRTKSSIIAQDVFQKINSEKINMFFARENLSSLFGSEYEKAYNSALHSAKVIIVIGTSGNEFEELLEKYKTFFDDKIVFPMYADIDAYDIPSELKTIQSLSYEKIGWQKDLEKALVKALRKEDSYDFTEKNIKELSRKTKIRILTISSVSVLLAAAVIFIVFFTPLVLTGKKYEYAQNQYESGEYTEAINTFYKIKDYKDSKKILYSIFQRYNGYYKDEKTNTTVHLVISNTLKTDIEVVRITESAQVKITESFQISSIRSDFSFNDSENNQGSGAIEFDDNGFILSVQTEEKNSDIFFDESYIHFLISEKSDKPFAEELTADTLISFLKNKVTLSELKRKGLAIEYVSPLYRNENQSLYAIKNTDINLGIYTYDVSISGLYEYYGTDESNVDDPIIFAISAPAELMIPEYIGKMNNPFVKNDILYVPNGTLTSESFAIDFWIKDENEAKTIERTTTVGFISKSELGAEIFEQLVEKYNASYY